MPRSILALGALALVLSSVLAIAVPVAPPPALAAETGKLIAFCSERDVGTAPPAFAPQLSQPVHNGIVQSGHLVTSADGTRLHVTAYRPATAQGAALPTILILSPYHALITYWKELDEAGVLDADCAIPFFTARGYNVVLGDMRGTHNSDGCFDMGGPRDTEDGVAIVNWIAAQGWSDGSVGMYGVSHVGMSQILTAIGAPPALKAIVPIAAPTQFYRYLHMNGAKYVLNTLTPPAYMGAVEAPPPLNAADENFVDNNLDTFCGVPAYGPQAVDFDGDFDAFWQARDLVARADSIRAPVLLVHGLHDENVKTDHAEILWRKLETLPVPHKAWFTQHDHSEPVHDWWNLTALRWFDHWLKGIDTGMMDEPEVTFQRSDGSWGNSTAWPPADAAARDLYLVDGRAELDAATASGAATYSDLPNLPRARHRDVPGTHLLYRSAPLAEDLRVTGAIRAHVTATVDAPDTNFAVLVASVAPDGTSTAVTRGYLDARHRASLLHGADLAPGETYSFSWELYTRAFVFPAGSSIEVFLASTDFCSWSSPAVEGCDNTGVYSDTTMATVTVAEGPGRTRLTLPVEP